LPCYGAARQGGILIVQFAKKMKAARKYGDVMVKH